MNTEHASTTGDFLNRSQSVVYAAQHLRRHIGGDRDALDYAASRLERALDAYEGGVSGYRSFMFSQLPISVAANSGSD
jgi:hypothetical protein